MGFSRYEDIGDRDQALDWFQQLAHVLQSDASLLNKLSDLAEAEQDKQQALVYLNEVKFAFSFNELID